MSPDVLGGRTWGMAVFSLCRPVFPVSRLENPVAATGFSVGHPVCPQMDGTFLTAACRPLEAALRLHLGALMSKKWLRGNFLRHLLFPSSEKDYFCPSHERH